MEEHVNCKARCIDWINKEQSNRIGRGNIVVVGCKSNVTPARGFDASANGAGGRETVLEKGSLHYTIEYEPS